MVRLPSIQNLVLSARSTFARFPFVIAAATVAAVAGIVSVDSSDPSIPLKIMVSAQLGFPLFFAIGVAGEVFRWPPKMTMGLSVAGVVALVAYYFTLPDSMIPGAITRFIQFNVGLHLAVAFLPFAGPGRINGFWQYNKALFLRFLQSVIYTLVIYLGLVVAMLAIDKLLGVPIDGEAYMRVWIVAALLFNTWMFVGGVPRDVAGLETVTDYPRAIKVFTQYVLIPLVIIYLTILTIYLFKVVFIAQWPSGWIGYLVSSVAVVGILALLLVWPVSARAENRWVATFTRWFFIFMIPAIAMLLLAIYKRIDQYGITENRYFLAVLALWLAGVALYFIISRRKSIKLIPATLCAIAFATAFGPWGAYSVSRHSQTGRLDALLEKNDIIFAGTVRLAPGEVSFEDRREISAITSYLVEHHGVDTFARWFGEERLAAMDSIWNESSTHDKAQVRGLMTGMGIEYLAQWHGTAVTEGQFNFLLDSSVPVFEIDGADYMVRLTAHGEPRNVGDGQCFIAWVDTVGVVVSDSSGIIVIASIDTLFKTIELNPQYDLSRLPPHIMRLHAESDGARLTVYFNSVAGTKKDGRRKISRFQADCFVKLMGNPHPK